MPGVRLRTLSGGDCFAGSDFLSSRGFAGDAVVLALCLVAKYGMRISIVAETVEIRWSGFVSKLVWMGDGVAHDRVSI
jgi:hypothetical protein